jgi:murein endopeptidase
MPVVSQFANGDFGKAAVNAALLGAMVAPVGGAMKTGVAARTGMM